MTPPSTAAPIPQAPDAERAIAGAMFKWPRAVGSLCAELGITESIFMDCGARAVFQVQMKGWAAGLEYDEIAVTEQLRPSGRLEEVGGVQFIMQLRDCAPSSVVIRHHCETIKGKALLRGIMTACSEYFGRAVEQEDEPSALIQEVSSAITQLACGHQRAEVKTLKELITEKIDRMTNGEKDADLLFTGLRRLDEVSPLRLGSVPLISGERKAGKSILAITIATNLIRAGKRVLYFTLEDPSSEVLNRISAGMSRVPTVRHHFVNNAGTERDCAAVINALKELATLPLTLRDDTYDITGIQAVARQEKAKHPDLACIVIDYAQLVRAKVSKGANREVEVATVSRAIRLLAMELKVAILLLCQLNKDGETRESKSLEQDATAMWKVNKTEESNERELEIPFQRNGESSVGLKLTFLGEIARFENYAA